MEAAKDNVTPLPQAQALALAKESSGTIQAFSSQGNFEAAQRMGKALASSSLVPEAYRNNLANVLIAMELAGRIGVSVFAAMQQLDIIHGRPSWRSQFLIATVNGCGRFSPIRYRFEGKPGTDSWGCRAYAKDRDSGEECVGPLITIAIAKAEGWYGKNGSKWKTLPELMLHYRAAAFWTRIYAPELSMGMNTVEEVEDIGPARIQSSQPLNSTSELEAAVLESEEPASSPAATKETSADPETGELPDDELDGVL